MFASVWVNALIIGMISACSMPLGSLTSLVWTPKNRALAFLVAFGGGAILAAVLVDLVGNATEKGHLLELVIGSILGSLFFTTVNKAVNNSGGFMRKPSTLLAYLTQQKQRQLSERLGRLKKSAFFNRLSPSLQQKIGGSLSEISYTQGTSIYFQGDPSESLYLLKKGRVNLVDPANNSAVVRSLIAYDIFDREAFLTGCPQSNTALVAEDCQLEILTRAVFEELLETSPELLEATAQTLQEEDLKDYLCQQQGLSLSQVQDWVTTARKNLLEDREIYPAVRVEQKQQEFLQIARRMERFPVFSYLPQDELQAIADRLVYSHYPSGHVFFQPQDSSERLYILEQGEVQIIYPSHLQQAPLILGVGDPFGELSLVTGAAHTVTAIAKTEVEVWTLRKQDWETTRLSSPHLEDSLKTFLSQPKLQEYLQKRQNLESSQAADWIKQALSSMNGGKFVPSPGQMFSLLHEHGNAPLSIWLGLLMDGIPEALTIGAHLATAPISPTLIAGLFIANYPEALSSSVGMRKQGFSVAKILGMWLSIMVITGLLSALGSIIFANVPDTVISLLESLAAGAILTVIAETMLPEAYAKGGSIVGLSTLLGFLVIILIGALNP